METKKLYIDYNEIFSYNKTLNFIVTTRGFGKTYGAKKYCIKAFLNRGEEFIFSKRYESDMTDTKGFFNKISQEFPEIQFMSDSKRGYVCRDYDPDSKENTWETCCHFIPLSKWQKIKSSEEYANVKTFLYDEFIKEKDTTQYLPDEPRALLNILDTIFRDRSDNWRCICMGNLSTVLNPFFLYFNIHIDAGAQVIQKDEIMVYLKTSDTFKQYRKNTRLGRLIEGTEYAEFANNNTPYMDSMSYVFDGIDQNSKLEGIIRIGKKDYGIWKTTYGYVMSHRHNQKHPVKLTTDFEEKAEGYQYISSVMSHPLILVLGLYFKRSQIFVDSMKIRDPFLELLYKTKIYNVR